MVAVAAYEESLRRFIAQHLCAERVDELCRDVWNAVYRALPAYRLEVTPRTWVLDLASDRLEARAIGGSQPRDGEADALERWIAALGNDERELLELRHRAASTRRDSTPRDKGEAERDPDRRVLAMLGARGSVLAATRTEYEQERTIAVS